MTLSMHNKSHHRAQGFTLLEVLVALAVFSVAAIALMRVSESQLQLSHKLEEKTFAHWIALNMISEMQTNQDWPNIGEQSGKVAMVGRDWKVVVNTKSTPIARVRRVDVTVGLAPSDFTDDMEKLTLLTGFLEQPSAQATTTGVQQ